MPKFGRAWSDTQEIGFLSKDYSICGLHGNVLYFVASVCRLQITNTHTIPENLNFKQRLLGELDLPGNLI